MKRTGSLVCLTALVLSVFVPCASAARGRGRGKPKEPPLVRYVSIDVQGSLDENRPPIYLLPTGGETLHELVGRLDKAGLDPAVQGIILRLGDFDAGWGKLQEIRRAIQRCRQAGKDVICMMEGGGNTDYYLATAADRICMTPAGQLMLVGLRLEAIFARDLLDKIGVRGDFIEVGKYKGGSEPFTRTQPSPAFQESLESLVQDYFDQLVTGIVQGRKMPISRVNLLIRRGPFTAEAAREAGLIDDVLFYDELVRRLRDAYGEGFRLSEKYARTRTAAGAGGDPAALLKMLMGLGAPGRPAPSGRPVIAVVHAGGPIVRQESDISLFGEQMTSAEALVPLLRKLAGDEAVRAIVLRVNSPGGSVVASDLIWRAVRLADERKPVIASLSDTAASGGYYIASGARKIFADSGTLTGSIGIFGGKLVLGDLFGKIGLNVTVIQRGGNTGLLSSLQEFSPQEREKLQEMLAAGYRLFLQRVAATRPDMAVADVERVAQGRVWTGDQARRNGLVDALGGLAEAIEAARAAAGLAPDEQIEVRHLPRSRNLAEFLFGSGDVSAMRSVSAMPGLLSALPLGGVPGLRAYVGALLGLRGELVVCMLPALISVR